MIWDVATGRLRDQIQVRANIFGCSISPDGRELALAEQLPGIEILDLEKPHEPAPDPAGSEQPRRRRGVQPGRIGRTLAMAGYGGGAGLLDVQKGRILDLFDEQVNHVAILAGLRGGRTHAGDGRR